ncbi:MAG: tyrosine-type recombinase/integrase [Acidobacteriota bacterium]|nr:tyrosine-type recombinase/integrase [Acidobacteriota bacterium]
MQDQSLSLVATSRGLEQLIAKTKSFIHGAKSPATLRAYRSDFEDFIAFCREHNLSHLPATPGIVALYISDRADSLAAATITRRLTSITKAHQAAGFEDSPASTHHFIVGETLKGIRRAIGTRQHCKDPLLTADIRRIIEHCPDSLLGTRDRALILVGFAGAFRRSELAAINLADVSFTPDGMVIDLRRSKTDQEGAGRKVGIPFGSDEDNCPVRALRHWLLEAGILSGPVFRSVNRHGRTRSRGLHKDSVGTILKRAGKRTHMKTAPLGGHSLRAECVTQAAMNGVNERDIMRQTGHKSSMMLGKYIRIGQMFTHNAATGLGL